MYTMPGMRALIINRSSRNGHVRTLKCRLYTVAKHIAPDIEIWECDPTDLVPCVRQAIAQGVEVLTVCGGDGTLSTVAASLANTNVALGIIPGGTHNHFARDLGIPLEPEAAMTVAFGTREHHVDLGEVNGRVFLNNCSLGLYASLVALRRQRQIHHGRQRAMVEALARTWIDFPLVQAKLSFENNTEENYRTPLLVVGNNRYGAIPGKPWRRARLDEAILSLYIAQSASRTELLTDMARTLLTGLQHAPRIRHALVHSLQVSTGQPAVPAAMDGEPVKLSTPLTFNIRPGALKVKVPQDP